MFKITFGKKKEDIIKRVLELTELACWLELSAERQRCMLDDISQNYFDNYDPADENGAFDIKHYFNTNRIKTDIMLDYAEEAKDRIKDINTCLNTLLEDLKNDCVAADQEEDELNNNAADTVQDDTDVFDD